MKDEHPQTFTHTGHDRGVLTAEGLLQVCRDLNRLTPGHQALADALQKLIDDKMNGQATHLVVQVGHGELASYIARHLKPEGLQVRESRWIPPAGDWFVLNTNAESFRLWPNPDHPPRFYDAR